MAVVNKRITEQFAIYNGDCIEAMAELPKDSIHFSIYSPPFAYGNGGLYVYSNDDRDLSNCQSYEVFFDHYQFVVKEITRITLPGRMSAVHCMDVPSSNSGMDHYIDFPGDIIRLHEKNGWNYCGRHCIWKEPLWVRNRTLTKNLAHKTIVDDSNYAGLASADYLLLFRKKGKNKIPVAHPRGLFDYAGESSPPADVASYRGWKGKQTENRWSHWIWRQYASCIWDDIRMNRVLPYQEARDSEDEKHVHPLQLDIIERAIELRSNPGENVLTPFMGVGSEAYMAVSMGRRAVGIELKTSYYNQAAKNIESLEKNQSIDQRQTDLFGEVA